MRASAWLPLAPIALLAAGWPACQPTGTKTSGTADAGVACGITVLYQNNGNGEIEPCG